MRLITDEFRGDDESLRDNIKALIELNDDGGLVPHGIGGHARTLLAAAYHRLAAHSGLAADAALWRGLMDCERIRLVGWTRDFNHMGVEFWRRHPAKHPCAEHPQDADRERLVAFASRSEPSTKGVKP